MLSTIFTHDRPTVTWPAAAISGRQCPICGSWNTQRHCENLRIWFTCGQCGGVFS